MEHWAPFHTKHSWERVTKHLRTITQLGTRAPQDHHTAGDKSMWAAISDTLGAHQQAARLESRAFQWLPFLTGRKITLFV